MNNEKETIQKGKTSATSNVVKVDVYTQDGKKKGQSDVSEVVFGAKWNRDLVHQVVVAMQANARNPIAHTKDRSDVRGGGKKPWQQKGLGRARHGSSRSPIWRGGGAAFGPRNDRVFAQKINRKMRAQALFAVLTKKYEDGNVLFVDALTFDAPKTAQAQATIATLAGIKGFDAMTTKKHNNVYIALPEKDVNVQKSFSNFGNVHVSEARNLNPVDAMKYKHIIVVSPEESVAELAQRASISREKTEESSVAAPTKTAKKVTKE